MDNNKLYFDETLLNDNVLDALYDMHFDVCTPIQAACIDPIIEGHDILGVAQTGTGKTAAYLLPILSRLDDGDFPEGHVNCLVMAPTRELAQQIDQAMQGFAYYLDGVSSAPIYGGNDGNRYDQELSALRKGASVIIATPGRLISHLQLGNLDLSKLSFFILDEADRMLDMGFSEDILTIAKTIPQTCQTIMFSATMPEKIESLAKTLLKNPINVKIAVSKPAEKIQQSAFVCYAPQKMKILKHIFKNGFRPERSAADEPPMKLERVIIFSGKKQRVKEIVATDIVARCIDIDDIVMVINYDVPHDVEDYVHRIGRTARAQRDGVAITLVETEDIWLFKKIEEFLERDILKNPMPEGVGEAPEYKIPATSSNAKPKGRRVSGRGQHNRPDKKNGSVKQGNRHNDTKKSNNKKFNNKKSTGNDRTEKRVRTQKKGFSHDSKRQAD